MAITSAICVPLSHIFIRNHLGNTLGWEAAGYWEAMWRFSSAYLLLITTTLSVYYLPKFSELSESSMIKSEVIQGYKIILPVAISFGLIIFIIRDYIISFLFTKDFFPMRALFSWQIIGDILKIGSWILAYIMTAKGLVGLYVTTEIIFSVIFIIISIVLTGIIGISGVVLAHAISYGCYWVVMAFSMRKIWKNSI